MFLKTVTNHVLRGAVTGIMQNNIKALKGRN